VTALRRCSARLEIAFGGGRVLLISPADKAGFLAALRRRSPRPTP